jgi:hypothetical protein
MMRDDLRAPAAVPGLCRSLGLVPIYGDSSVICYVSRNVTRANVGKDQFFQRLAWSPKIRAIVAQPRAAS